MIKKDTIVSTTDGRLTLLQWLKKVEAALKNASATAVKGVPQADGKVVFEIDFADGTSIKSDPFELPEKLPEGYAVDAAGNVTIAGALTANNNGNVEVNGKELYLDGRRVRIRSYKEGASDNVDFQLQNTDGLYKTVLRIRKNDVDGDVKVEKDFEVDGNATFSGKNCFVWHGTTTETIEGMTVTSNVSGLFFQGPIVTIDGQTMGDPGIFALTAMKSDDGIDCYLINPKHYDPATKELRPATVEEILAGDWSFYLSVDTGTTLLRDRSDARLTTLRANKVMGSENDPAIDWMFKVENENISLGEIAQVAKKVKYQHTVHITSLNDVDKQLNVSFTAMSSNDTPVNSYQNLHTVFGGRNLTVSGNAKYYSMQLPVYLDLHGGTMDTDKIYLSSAESVGAYQQPALSAFPSIAFTDEVK